MRKVKKDITFKNFLKFLKKNKIEFITPWEKVIIWWWFIENKEKLPND